MVSALLCDDSALAAANMGSGVAMRMPSVVCITSVVALLVALASRPAAGTVSQDGRAEATISALQTEVASLETQVASENSSHSPTPIPTPTPPLADDVGLTRGNPADLGEEVVAGDVALTVVEVVWGEEAAASVKEANPYNPELPPEQEYVAIQVRARNIGSSSEPQDIYGAHQFGVTGSANVLYTLGAVAPEPELEASLLPGGEVEGWGVKRIDAEETNIELVYMGGYSYEDWRYMALEEGARLPAPAGEGADTALSSMIGAEPNDLGAQRSDPAGLGEAVVMPPYAAEVVQSVQGDEATALLIEAGSEESLDLAAGNEYVLVEVQVTYVGHGEVPVHADFYDFTVSGSANVAYSPKLNVLNFIEHMNPAGPLRDLDLFLYPGGVGDGWLLYQVKRGETNLVLGYEPTGGDTRFLAAE